MEGAEAESTEGAGAVECAEAESTEGAGAVKVVFDVPTSEREADVDVPCIQEKKINEVKKKK